MLGEKEPMPVGGSPGWTARAIRAQAASPRGRAIGIVSILLAMSWLVSYVLGGAGRVPPHWFYVPVLVAATRFGLAGAAATAVAAGLLAGPLLPLDVATGEPQQFLDWSARLGFFLGIGLVMAAIIVRLKTSLERDRAREEAERGRLKAEQANQAKNEFLSRMSHELRTPLNAILGFSELLQMEGLDPRQEECVQQILRGGRHLLDLINEVLDVSRIEAGRITISQEPVHLAEALDEALHLIRPLADQAQVRLIEPEERFNVFVRADRQRLKQVFLNLLSNAVKFNREHGEVRIAGAQVTAGSFRVEISDTGVGISNGHINELFTPFARLGAEERGIEGTGLGLTLSKGLVDIMGGKLGASSAPEVGSTFWVELPLADESELESTELPEAQQDEGASAAPRTVLYIEDNLTNLQLIERILAYRPAITLRSAMQGSLGIELAKEHRPDMILLDLHLPDMPGEEVLRRLGADEQTRDIPIVVVTADASEGISKKLRASGATTFVSKPLNVSLFLETVDEILGLREALHE